MATRYAVVEYFLSHQRDPATARVPTPQNSSGDFSAKGTARTADSCLQINSPHILRNFGSNKSSAAGNCGLRNQVAIFHTRHIAKIQDANG
jgi:hypothetical protein